MMDGECTTEFHSRLNWGQAIGASLQKIWKSDSIPISTKIRLMKALVWPVATYGCESCRGHSERMKKHVLTPLRRKGREIFCGFRGQQRKQINQIKSNQISGFLTKLE